MEHKWNYNGSDFLCDICDCEVFEKLDSALQKLSGELSSIELSAAEDKKNDIASKLRKNCEVIEEFFKTLFGNDAAMAICGEKYNLINHTTSLASFLCYIEGEIGSLKAAGDEIKTQLCSRLGIGGF